MSDAPERRAGGEVRVAGRTLTGIAMPYRIVSPDFRERFEPGAFGEVRAVDLNLQHDPGTVLARAATLTDGPEALRVSAELPEGAGALALVRRGALRGFSVEFRAKAERREGGVRVVARAVLSGLALVDRPAYPGAGAEVRARSGRTLRSTVPYDRDLACECISQGGAGSACVPLARFSKEAGEAMAEAINQAYEEAARDVLAVFKDYSRPLGSARRGTLRARDGGDGLTVEVDLPTGEAGDMAVSASEAAGIIVRPLIDMDRSEFTDTDRGREYTRPHVRAFLVGSTDARDGWPDARIDYDGERAAPLPRIRRVWL